MTLRSRISLAFLGIAVILVAPALFGLRTLWELRDIAQELRTRDAMGALALGRLQTAFGEVETWQRNFFALAEAGGDGRALAAQRVETNIREVEASLALLVEAGYEEHTRLTRARWDQARRAIEYEQQLVASGTIAEVDAHRAQVVDPLLAEVARTFEPIAQAINATVEQQAQQAELIADRSATTTVIALTLAISFAFLIAALLTRSILRPLHELRAGMSMVAGGNFEPPLRIHPDRPDELGDLARSFQRMTRQLAELDRLQAEFVSVASHELKTPLSVIKGYVSLLQEGIYGEVAANQRKILASVSDQTDRLGRLIQQLLDISRFEAGGGRLEIRPIDLRHFLVDLTTSFEALAVQHQIRFELAIDDGLPELLQGDPDRLNEVVGNLLSNAFKFTPRGGSIWLRAAPQEGGVAIDVEDTGVGIPASHIARIFEKFYQVENTAQPKSIGSGLGLAISREIVEAHGGTITAESEPGRGTTFRVFLPDSVSAV